MTLFRFLLITLFAFTVGWVLGSFLDAVSSKSIEKQQNEEWCLLDSFNGSEAVFGSNTAGQYEYQVIATQNGIKVYQKCVE